MAEAPNIADSTPPAEPVAVAQEMFDAPGFSVSRNGENVEVRISAPMRGAPILINWIFNLLVLGGCLYAITALVPLWEINEDGVNSCSIVGTGFIVLILPWYLVGAMRRIARAHRRGAETVLGVTDGVLWCEPADAPSTRYRWPVPEVSRLRGQRPRFSLRSFWLEVRSRHRSLMRIRISSRHKIAVEPLIYLLQHAMTCVPVHPRGGEPDGAQSATLAYANPAAPTPTDPTVRYFGGDIPIGWARVASYPRFSDFHIARAALWVVDIPGRLGSQTVGAEHAYELLVPEGHAEQARRLIVRPREWLDRSHCPRCGHAGERRSLPRRIAHSIRHPMSPITLSDSWRFCTTCRLPFSVRSSNGSIIAEF